MKQFFAQLTNTWWGILIITSACLLIWLILSALFYKVFFKRFYDIVLSAIALIILSIPFLIIAFLIKFDSKGPVFFKQERLGLNGKVFKIIKFRTMVQDAEKMGDGIRVKNEEDPRITKIGKFLRKTSLDELPQLINVFIGDMSLVGPRPPLPYHPYKYENYDNYQKIRFNLRPGITGLAQVVVRNSVSWEERIKYDVDYVNKLNIFLDIKLLIKTFFKIFKTEKIYLQSNI